ncbi:MAG TPA: MtrB/PioB family decaheme-associated outer membrane protein [Woeseiaceae bacterium]|nr:MtrB/PioB family decaheme-associated outer membrane protein [Woeseiaceae bacterium]
MSLSKKLLVVVSAAVSIPIAHSQAVDTSDWVCEYCPFESGRRSDISAGASQVSDDSAHLGDATGYSESGTYANLDGDGSIVSDRHQLQWQVEDLGLDSRFVELQGGRQGSYEYTLAYRQLPHTQYFTTDTILVQSAADTLSLPDGWIRAPQTSGFAALDDSLVQRDIESERRTLQLGGRYLATSRLQFSAQIRRQEQDGLRVNGGSYFTQSSLLPAPFDFTTDTVDVGVRYAGDNGFLSLGYFLSEFDNSLHELRWENPFTGAAGAEFAAQAQAPGNSFQQLRLNGNYRLTQYDTVIAFTGAVGQLDQDATFLPYTTNSNLNVAPLPRSQLDGDVATANLAVSVASRINDRIRVRAGYRYDERDNQTPVATWSRVIADTFLSGEAETNTPYSFKRTALSGALDFDAFDTVRVSGGVDRQIIDRDYQEVAEQTEDTGWGRLRWRPQDVIQVDIKGGVSERDIDLYDETFASGLGQNPLLRKYNLAYRYRRFGEMTVSATLPESPVSITLTGLFADDDYAKSRLGLTSGDDIRLAADLSWSISETASVYVSGGYENLESTQAGSESFATEDWQAENSDDFYTAAAGFHMRQIAGKFDLQLDYTRSEGASEITLDSASTGLSQFPDLESTFDYLRLRLDYDRSEKMQWNVDIRYQRFLAEDWALEGVGPATIPVILTMGAQPYDEKSLIFGIGFRYRMGAATTASGSGGQDDE